MKKKKMKSCNKKLSYQTQRSYITALRHLVNFLKVSDLDTAMPTSKLVIFDQGLEDLSKSKKKGVLREQWRKGKKDLKHIAKNADVKSYLQCQAREETINRIKKKMNKLRRCFYLILI